jgi:2-polyprenyl-3-methyl-5-hydroxy-6-metoxy-1,4-benzoquinol methylase
MINNIKCPLCSSDNLNITEQIKVNEIVEQWLKQNNDTTYLFSQSDFLNKIKCQECGLVFFDPIVSGDNDFYSTLGKEEWYYLHDDKTEFEYANKYIKDDDFVLDIGSGRGAFTKYINKNIYYTGLELSSKAIEYANKENINVIEQTIENHVELNKNKYNVVVTFQVLEHISSIETFIESAIGTLQDNGIFIIAVPNNDAFIKNAQNNLLNLPPHHLLHWNEKSLKYLANKFNLDIIDIYKEKVTNVHKAYYYSVQISKMARDILGMKTKSINTSIANKVIQKLSSIITRIIKYTNIHKNKDGQTIAIVLKKINA